MTLAPHPPLTDFYDDPAGRESFVRDIFDESAPWYDRATALMSFGAGNGHRYRKEALERAGLKPGMKLLDVATGTGVVARAAASITRNITGLDPSIGMLAAGKAKSPLPKVQAVSEHLPFADQSFDMISIGFAMRHFADLNTVFKECRRVLKPGGRLLILEITAPRSRLARWSLGAYMGVIVPALIGLISRNKRAATMMRYYWVTTRECVRPEVILDAMKGADFAGVNRHVEMSLFSEYSGLREEARP